MTIQNLIKTINDLDEDDKKLSYNYIILLNDDILDIYLKHMDRHYFTPAESKSLYYDIFIAEDDAYTYIDYFFDENNEPTNKEHNQY